VAVLGVAVLGMARPQDVEESGMAGPGETLGSLWILLAIRACIFFLIDIAACKGLVQKKTAEESFPVCTAKALCPDSSWALKMWNFGGVETGSC
jgi:hypothetical protein